MQTVPITEANKTRTCRSQCGQWFSSWSMLPHVTRERPYCLAKFQVTFGLLANLLQLVPEPRGAPSPCHPCALSKGPELGPTPTPPSSCFSRCQLHNLPSVINFWLIIAYPTLGQLLLVPGTRDGLEAWEGGVGREAPQGWHRPRCFGLEKLGPRGFPRGGGEMSKQDPKWLLRVWKPQQKHRQGGFRGFEQCWGECSYM